MSLLVLKFGGTSVGSAERVRAVARYIAAVRERGHEVVVVVSAMGDTTDRLLDLAAAIAPGAQRRGRELDLLLATGEQSAAALLALALDDAGVRARALTGAQAGIRTDGRYGDARIRAVHAARVRRVLAGGGIPVVAGFQGVSARHELTTLGRGGSDTTAVALAIALGAQRCDIYTDVDGIYSADPRVVATARRHARLSYRDALHLTLAGAAVLHARAAALALAHELPLRVLSSLRIGIDPDPADGGTLIDGASSVDTPRILGVVTASRAAQLEAPVARLTIVGTSVSTFGARITDAMQQLAHAGIDAATVGVTRLGFAVHVAPPHADNAVRLLHDALLGAEHHPSRRPETRRDTTHATPTTVVGSGSAA